MGQRVEQRNITSLVGGGKFCRVYKLITFGFPGSSENLLSNWPDQPPPPCLARPLPLTFLHLPVRLMEWFLDKTRTKLFVKTMPVFSSMGPKPVTQSKRMRGERAKKNLFKKQHRQKEIVLVRACFAGPGPHSNLLQSALGRLWGRPARGPSEEGSVYSPVCLGSLPGAKFKVQFPVICWTFSGFDRPGQKPASPSNIS